jgi:hypothetical protein
MLQKLLAGCQKPWITNVMMLWAVAEITGYQAGS